MSIEIRDLSFIYDPEGPFEKRALDNVSLTIEKGKITGIMGRTGCGKSTLIQLIAGLYLPTSGTIMTDGEDINSPEYDRLKLRSKMGVVFQYPETQLFETTAYKDVAFGLKHSELTDEEKDENIRWALSVTGFDFDEIKDKSPLGLSGGEKRRLAIAGVLAVRPEYLILDEPVAGLDPTARERFLDLLKELNREGMTIIMISHNTDAMTRCAQDLILLKGGRVRLAGEIHDVFSDSAAMEECGVAPGSAQRTAMMLAGRGLDMKPGIISIEELMLELVRVWTKSLRPEEHRTRKNKLSLNSRKE
jgi:energy-coupling factor transport system ATP-binding protein